MKTSEDDDVIDYTTLKDILTKYYNNELTLDEVKSVWSIGDTITINLSAMPATYVSESHVAQSQKFAILDFDHDILVNKIGNKTKALLTLQQVNVLSNGTEAETGFIKEPVDGYCDNSGGWEQSERRTWCNNIYYNALPNEIKSLVKQVIKETYNDYSTKIITTSNEYCFLPSSTETNVQNLSNIIGQEGTAYPYFYRNSSAYEDRIKYIGNSNITGKAISYWTRSIMNYYLYWLYVRFDGTDNYNKSYGTENGFGGLLGIAPAFCL
jgi:hypothetical protein